MKKIIEILGITKSATEAEIKSLPRKKAANFTLDKIQETQRQKKVLNGRQTYDSGLIHKEN
jgi:DnaJ-class molecular chaperone